MYLVQKRKNANSQWHTVKDSHGKKCASEDVHVLIGKIERLKGDFPRAEFRVIDNATGFAVEDTF